jgi:hypothetical protein
VPVGGCGPVDSEDADDVEAALRVIFADGIEATLKDEGTTHMPDSRESPAKLNEVGVTSLGEVGMRMTLYAIFIEDNRREEDEVAAKANSMDKSPGIGKGEEIGLGICEAPFVRLFNEAEWREINEVIFFRGEEPHYVSERPGEDNVVVAEYPEILAGRLLVTLKEVRVCADVLCVTDVMTAKTVLKELSHYRFSFVWRGIVGDEKFDLRKGCDLRPQRPQQERKIGGA